MTHKVLSVIQVHIRIGDATTRILLPDDPSTANPQPNDYSNDLEVNEYCRNTIESVIGFVEGVYPFISPLTANRYRL